MFRLPADRLPKINDSPRVVFSLLQISIQEIKFTSYVDSFFSLSYFFISKIPAKTNIRPIPFIQLKGFTGIPNNP